VWNAWTRQIKLILWSCSFQREMYWSSDVPETFFGN
jgi:hypothetical protein